MAGTSIITVQPKKLNRQVNPVVLGPRAVPSNMANDGASPVLFTAFVVDPNEDLSSVEINLSSLGGISNQPMYDDGTNGDETPGDEIYSYRLSGTTVAVGNYTLTITATDSTNIGTGEISLVVHDEPGVYILDNLEAIFSPFDWDHYSGPPYEPWEYFSIDYQIREAGTGDYTATWEVPSYMPAGTYKVYARWAAYSNRATNVYYTISYDGGSSDVGPFDQTQNSGTWIDLGQGTTTYPFAAGSGSVVVTDNANGKVCVDAVKWEPQP